MPGLGSFAVENAQARSSRGTADSTVGTSEIGALTIDVTLVPVDGRSVDIADVPVDLVRLTQGTWADFRSNGIVRKGTSNTFTFSFASTATLRAGQVAVSVGNTWHDSAGNTATAAATLTIADATASVAAPGAVIGLNAIGAAAYVDVTFLPVGGRTVDASTITGNEITISGPTTLTVGSPVRVGSSNTFRYALTGGFAVGRYVVSIIAGSWSDSGGNAGLAASSAFTVDTLSSDLTFPTDNGTVGRTVLNTHFSSTQAAVDVTLYSVGSARVNVASLVDKLTLSGPGAAGVTATSTIVQVSGNTYRFVLSGLFQGGDVFVTIGGWSDDAGNVAPSQTENFFVDVPSAALTDPVGHIGRDELNNRDTFDVTFTPAAGGTLNAASITTATVTLTGATAGVVITGVARVGSSNTFRFTFSGSFGAGDVAVTVNNTWRDAAGNVPLAVTRHFTVEVPTVTLATPLAGEETELSSLNASHYLEVVFTPTTGRTLNDSTVQTGDLVLGGTASVGVAITGVTKVATNRFRFAFTGAFTSGPISASFAAGSFADSGGNLALASSESINAILTDRNVNSIAGHVTVDGGGPNQPSGEDTLEIDDRGDTAGNVGMLTSSTVTGLGMGSTNVLDFTHGVQYSNIERLNIHLGSGDDLFLVRSNFGATPAVGQQAGNTAVLIQTQTLIETGAGSDRILVGSNAKPDGTNTGGNVNGILGLLTIDGGSALGDPTSWSSTTRPIPPATPDSSPTRG